MSFFSKVFGGKKEAAAPTTSEAIQKLRETEDMLIKKQDFLEGKIELEIGLARKNGTKNKRVTQPEHNGQSNIRYETNSNDNKTKPNQLLANKRAAIQALKRKKRYEKQLQQIDGTLSTIEMQREALENANTNTTVITTMKNAADALKAAHQHMDVDQVHDMMDDIAEQQDVAKEISEAISNPVAFGQDVDEEELERELEELEQEQLDKELLGIESTGEELPSVPATDVPVAPAKTRSKAKPVEEDPDLKELEAWAS